MRPVDTIIIHCTATPPGRDVRAEDIRRWHRARGWKDIGYHWVVCLDGTVERGRDEADPGAHCRGHNARSIGVCYAGGVAADGRTPADTRTEAQKASLRALAGRLRSRYPAARVVGHRDLDPRKACPSFDVATEL